MRRTVECDESTPLGIGVAIEHLNYIIDALNNHIGKTTVKVYNFIGISSLKDYHLCYSHAVRLCNILKARQKKYDLSDDTPIETVYLGLMLSVLNKARDLKIIHLIPARRTP